MIKKGFKSKKEHFRSFSQLLPRLYLSSVKDFYDLSIIKIIDPVLISFSGYKGNMKSILKIKDHYLKIGITNTYLAEKSGITPADLFELDEKNLYSKKALIERVASILEVNPLDLSVPSPSRNFQKTKSVLEIEE